MKKKVVIEMPESVVPVRVNSTIQTIRCDSDLSTRKGQRIQLSKIVILSMLPVLILTVETCINVYNGSHDLQIKQQIKTDIQFSIETGTLVHNAQIERGTTALYVSSNGDSYVYKTLKQRYKNTDAALKAMRKWIPFQTPKYFQSKESFIESLENFRNSLNPMIFTVSDVIRFYTDNNAILINWIIKDIAYFEKNSKWWILVAYHMLIMSKEEAGIERALGSTYYSKGGFSIEDLLWYNEKKILGETYLRRAEQYSSLISTILKQRYIGTELQNNIIKMQNQIVNNSNSAPSVIQGVVWFDNMTEYINMLKDVEETVGKDLIQNLDESINNLKEGLVLDIMLMFISLMLFPTAVFLIYKLTKKIQLYAHSLQEKTTSLEAERKRSDALLYQMLPVSVAEKLLQNKRVPPEHFSDVTLYFSDIVGFTFICSQRTPFEVVEMLNFMYKTFDSRIGMYDVYKVETIGDAYMVASGLPQRNGIRHVAEISSLALDTVQTISTLSVPYLNGKSLKIRIGLNTGPVVAGVVGNKMPRYCLFGDTVNVASRMESAGQPLKIHISESTFNALKDFPEFITERRGNIEVKGKGLMTTYWLLGKNTINDLNV